MIRTLVGGIFLAGGTVLWILSLVGWASYVLGRQSVIGVSDVVLYMFLGLLCVVAGVILAPYEIPLDIDSIPP